MAMPSCVLVKEGAMDRVRRYLEETKEDIFDVVFSSISVAAQSRPEEFFVRRHQIMTHLLFPTMATKATAFRSFGMISDTEEDTIPNININAADHQKSNEGDDHRVAASVVEKQKPRRIIRLKLRREKVDADDGKENEPEKTGDKISSSRDDGAVKTLPLQEKRLGIEVAVSDAPTGKSVQERRMGPHVAVCCAPVKKSLKADDAVLAAAGMKEPVHRPEVGVGAMIVKKPIMGSRVAEAGIKKSVGSGAISIDEKKKDVAEKKKEMPERRKEEPIITAAAKRVLLIERDAIHEKIHEKKEMPVPPKGEVPVTRLAEKKGVAVSQCSTEDDLEEFKFQSSKRKMEQEYNHIRDSRKKIKLVDMKDLPRPTWVVDEGEEGPSQ